MFLTENIDSDWSNGAREDILGGSVHRVENAHISFVGHRATGQQPGVTCDTFTDVCDTSCNSIVTNNNRIMQDKQQSTLVSVSRSAMPQEYPVRLKNPLNSREQYPEGYPWMY